MGIQTKETWDLLKVQKKCWYPNCCSESEKVFSVTVQENSMTNTKLAKTFKQLLGAINLRFPGCCPSLLIMTPEKYGVGRPPHYSLGQHEHVLIQNRMTPEGKKEMTHHVTNDYLLFNQIRK